MKLMDTKGVIEFFGLNWDWNDNNRKKIIRLLKNIESERQITLLTKIADQYFTTEALLKKAIPELFVPSDEDTIADLKNQIFNLTQRLAKLESKLSR